MLAINFGGNFVARGDNFTTFSAKVVYHCQTAFFFYILTESQFIEEDKSSLTLAIHENIKRAILKKQRINKLVGKFVQELFLCMGCSHLLPYCHREGKLESKQDYLRMIMDSIFSMVLSRNQ